MTGAAANELAPAMREECFGRLGEARHYADLAQGFLQIGDDCGAFYAFQQFVENARAAQREIKGLRGLYAPAIEHREAAE